MTETTVSLSFLFQKNVHCLCKTYQTEHCGKTVSMDKAFLCQEIMLEKSGLFHHEANTLIHVAHAEIHNIGKLLLQEVLSILGSLGDIA